MFPNWIPAAQADVNVARLEVQIGSRDLGGKGGEVLPFIVHQQDVRTQHAVPIGLNVDVPQRVGGFQEGRNRRLDFHSLEHGAGPGYIVGVVHLGHEILHELFGQLPFGAPDGCADGEIHGKNHVLGKSQGIGQTGVGIELPGGVPGWRPACFERLTLSGPARERGCRERPGHPRHRPWAG